MTTQFIRPQAWRAGLACAVLALASCSKSGSSGRTATTIPNFSTATFSAPTQIDNPYFPLVPGTVNAYLGEDGDDSETILVEVLDDTRVVSGIPCVVVRDRVFDGDLLVEDTHDWYAQDDAGNVWYMGEEVDNYNFDDDDNLIDIDHDGAWEAGLDVAGTGSLAQPGYLMRASPMRGQKFYQEYYPGAAEDTAEVIALDVPVTLSDGRSFSCLQVRETNPLSSGPAELKYFAPGLGLVLEQSVGAAEKAEHKAEFHVGRASVPDFGGSFFTNPSAIDNPFVGFQPDRVHTFLSTSEDEAEIIVVERLNDERVILGLECAVVRDRVFVDGLLIEDTRDWYAEDDAGNVWYMGEDVDNYNYDDDGKLIDIDHDGAWEAGADTLGAGSVAEPGYQMKASAAPGDSYYQEFYEGEAEDMAFIVAVGVAVELADGRTFTGCIQAVEWNPLEPEALEYKYFAPGLGIIVEEKLGHAECAEHTGTFNTGPGAIADFGAASFSDPSDIDHVYLNYRIGTTFTYEKETEDVLETIVVEVLDLTRTVLGIECAVVRDRVFLDGVLIEDTHDWYAEDDAGNVWYMGESVDNYNYDDDGNLVDIDNDGAWEAGLDVAGAGAIARPGHAVQASPTVGSSYQQELYEGEAEDRALVVSLTATVELGDGTVYESCLQTLEWDPLDPGGLEYKYYAPGVGLVLEEELGSDESVELTSVSP